MVRPAATAAVSAVPPPPPSAGGSQAQPGPAAKAAVPAPEYRLPESATLQSATKWAIIEDKPIMMDYWADSLEKKAFVGVKKDNQEKLLVKSADEYTSPIVKIFRNKGDLIIMTENSIYLVDAGVDVKELH
jgi:hypothetical protein